MNKIFQHDVRRTPWPIARESVHTIVTSPPYWGLRDYGHEDQLGLEETPELYIENMVKVFREAREVLRNDGTMWVNIGDTYWGGKGQSGAAWKGDHLYAEGQNISGKGETRPQDRRHPFIKPKDLVGIPWMLAFALRNDGWYLRQDIIWHKPNPMPESVTDRCSKSHEYIFLFSKSKQYYFDAFSISTPYQPKTLTRHNAKPRSGRGDGTKLVASEHWNLSECKPKKWGQTDIEEGRANKKSVWSVATFPYSGAHFATYPPQLIEDCIKAGCPPDGTVLDMFFGAGTTGISALANGRQFIGLEVKPDYIDLANRRLKKEFPLFYTY